MNRPLRWSILLLLSAAVLATPGCGGCRPETPQERAARLAREEQARLKRLEEQKKKEKKPPIEARRPLPQPTQSDQPLAFVKPGHWMSATQATKANYKDWVGRAQQQIVNTKSDPIAIDRTAFTLRTSRAAALVKGKEKQLETILFLPNTFDASRMRTLLLDRGGGYAVAPSEQPMNRMLPHQYHFVVLAAEPERYGFLRNGNYAVDAPLSNEIDVEAPGASVPARRNYRVVAPGAEGRLPLADNPLCWTTTAYVLWDEVDPERLDPAQRDAMIDWLHWGGQLIVNGPDSLDLLADSFLSPYLPADGGGARDLDAEALRPLADAYQVSSQPETRLTVDAAWSGVRLRLRPEAAPIPEVRDLFAERRVGRGRVIVSAMQLAERRLINWSGGFENLFNALVLRRPPRRFAKNPGAFDGKGLYIRDARLDLPQLDPTANTRVRFFSRDTLVGDNKFRYRLKTTAASVGQTRWGQDGIPTYHVPAGLAGGAGAWSDFNASANAAREALREAAGVKVPQRGFVLGCLGVYLAVIGPLNWFFFRALGRVELAWVAAPVITIVGTVAVVRLAELDIGFARAQTEIAILETQPEHPRGHLTRYTAVYSSLATTYEFSSDEPTTLIAPFARSRDFKRLRGQSLTEVVFERQENVRLRGFVVSSAATDMAHTEQMVALPGGLEYDPKRRRIVNRTGHDLDSLAVVRRDERAETPSLLGCWIGSLPGGQGIAVQFSPIAFSEDGSAYAAERAAEAELADEGRLNLEPLFLLALDPSRLARGEVRAVARVDQTLPGLELSPRAAQSTGATLLVAHLQYPPLPAPRSDANAPIDVERDER